MWKWLGGCLIVVVVLFVVLFWWSMRTIRNSTAPDGSVSVMIGAPPERVFASMSNGDSVATWMAQGNTVLSTRSGRLQPGDMLRIRFRGTSRDALSWEVGQVVPNRLLVLHLKSDSTGQAVATRRDSISAEGDSTRVSSRLISPMLPASGPAADSGSDDALYDMTSGLVLSMFRLQSKVELTRLKERIEGSSR
jgi:uncharacterized protein YndB with AHSA1/START domain